MNIRKILAPIAVFAVGIVVMVTMMKTAPDPKRKEKKKVEVVVEVQPLKKEDFPITIKSHGTVQPGQQTTLVAEVSGKVVATAAYFKDGDYISKHDVLLEIDPRDYRNAVTIAQSELAKQRVAVSQEEAQAEQAKLDWTQLGQKGKPSDLVLRKPQMASARAAAAGAQAKLEQAKVNLERTKITAPYDGRILERSVEIGQYLTKGSPVATMFSTNYVEIKLPLSDAQSEQIVIEERFRDEKKVDGPAVTFRKGGSSWQGRIVRSAAAIDSKSRQQFVIAQVDNPYARQEGGQMPLKIGLFVEAEIIGKTLKDVFIVPRPALRENGSVLLVEEGKLKRQAVNVVWSENEKVIVSGDLKEGDSLIVSPLSYAVEGTPVTVQTD